MITQLILTALTELELNQILQCDLRIMYSVSIL